jgi:hypothetical protein
MTDFRGLIRKKVDRLFFVVWPPWGEEKESDIDISFGFVFNDDPDGLCIISIDKDELWSPYVFYQNLPNNAYSWEDFYPRMKTWMKAQSDDEDNVIDTEYYDVTECVLFEKIVGSEIIGIEFLSIEDSSDAFGVKLLFEKDYIISTPISDGNTVETSQFNQNNNIGIFQNIGKVIYKLIT